MFLISKRCVRRLYEFSPCLLKRFESAVLIDFIFSVGITAHMRIMAATIKMIRLSGRVTKMLKLPPEMMSDRRKAGSRTGLRTLAITNGAIANPVSHPRQALNVRVLPGSFLFFIHGVMSPSRAGGPLFFLIKKFETPDSGFAIKFHGFNKVSV